MGIAATLWSPLALRDCTAGSPAPHLVSCDTLPAGMGLGWLIITWLGPKSGIFQFSVLIDCLCPGSVAKRSRLLGGIFFGLCSFVFLSGWLLVLQVWDIRGKKKTQKNHHDGVPRVTSSPWSTLCLYLSRLLSAESAPPLKIICSNPNPTNL